MATDFQRQNVDSLQHQRVEYGPLGTTDASELARLKTENDELRLENVIMRQTLEIIAGRAADGLQRVQAIGALTNIGRKV